MVMDNTLNNMCRNLEVTCNGGGGRPRKTWQEGVSRDVIAIRLEPAWVGYRFTGPWGMTLRHHGKKRLISINPFPDEQLILDGHRAKTSSILVHFLYFA